MLYCYLSIPLFSGYHCVQGVEGLKRGEILRWVKTYIYCGDIKSNWYLFRIGLIYNVEVVQNRVEMVKFMNNI